MLVDLKDSHATGGTVAALIGPMADRFKKEVGEEKFQQMCCEIVAYCRKNNIPAKYHHHWKIFIENWFMRERPKPSPVDDVVDKVDHHRNALVILEEAFPGKYKAPHIRRIKAMAERITGEELKRIVYKAIDNEKWAPTPKWFEDEIKGMLRLKEPVLPQTDLLVADERSSEYLRTTLFPKVAKEQGIDLSDEFYTEGPKKGQIRVSAMQKALKNWRYFLKYV